MEKLVEAAQNSRSKTQRLIDSCSKYYTPGTQQFTANSTSTPQTRPFEKQNFLFCAAVVALAASVTLVPLLLGAEDIGRWFRLALVLLVSACPCALVLSTPVATFCALLTAARMGVLVKGGDILEALGRIKVAAFDKTGTITKGEFSIDGFYVVGDDDKADLNQLLYWYD